MKSARTKAVDINSKVKKTVWERDGHRCILCGSANAMPNAHYRPRSKGGLGIEQNVVTLRDLYVIGCVLIGSTSMLLDGVNTTQSGRDDLLKIKESIYGDA